MQHRTSPTTTPTAVARLRRAAAHGRAMLAQFGSGVTGINLSHRFIMDAPADIDTTEEGHTARCWGIQTPACSSETEAIVTWARMATELEAGE